MITAIKKWFHNIFKNIERVFLMMAMFFAQRVILGKTAFDDVPKALKSGCAEVLIESGLPELVPTEYGGTAKA